LGIEQPVNEKRNVIIIKNVINFKNDEKNRKFLNVLDILEVYNLNYLYSTQVLYVVFIQHMNEKHGFSMFKRVFLPLLN